MKKILFFIFLNVLAFGAFAQENSLKIKSNIEGVDFRLYVDGVKQNNFFQSEVEVENILGKKHFIKIVFEDKKIADLNKTIKYKKNGTLRIYAIAQNSDFKKSIGKLGRRISKKDQNDKKLTDTYKVVFISETPLLRLVEQVLRQPPNL